MPEKLSLDEFSKKKGNRKFATVVCDLEKKSLLEVIDSHKSEEIDEVFPNALIVIDRFHVMKLVNKALNKLRLFLELKGLKNRYLLLKNGRDLTEEEKNALVELLQKSPSLSIAYELKEEFRDIYETSTTVKMGRRRFKKWLITASCIFGSITKTIVKHLEEICNYFISRTSSGMMEGLNNKIKLILRQSYGFKNFDLMREKLLACLQK
jgi:transposase